MRMQLFDETPHRLACSTAEHMAVSAKQSSSYPIKETDTVLTLITLPEDVLVPGNAWSYTTVC